MSLDQVTNAIHARLTDFTGLGARVMFDFGDDGTICIDAKSTPPVVCAADDDMDCRIRLSIADMGKLMAGNLNPTLAYTLGKLRVDGSLGIAMKLAARLDD